MVKNILALGLVLSLFSFCYAQEESLTITTYYPSPYGVYKTLRLYPGGSPAPNDNCLEEDEGALVYYKNPTDYTKNKVLVCKQTGPAIYQWQSSGLGELGEWVSGPTSIGRSNSNPGAQYWDPISQCPQGQYVCAMRGIQQGGFGIVDFETFCCSP